jgi:hypothetical protein
MRRKEFLKDYNQEVRVIQHLFRKAEGTDLSYRPQAQMMSTGQVIRHLSEGVAEGLESLITGQWPYGPDAMLPTLDKIPSYTSLQEAQEALEKDCAGVNAYVNGMAEEVFQNKEVTTPWGENGRYCLIAAKFAEHMKMHKMQLFLYLRIQGVAVNTMDLYAGSP